MHKSFIIMVVYFLLGSFSTSAHGLRGSLDPCLLIGVWQLDKMRIGTEVKDVSSEDKSYKLYLNQDKSFKRTKLDQMESGKWTFDSNTDRIVISREFSDSVKAELTANLSEGDRDRMLKTFMGTVDYMTVLNVNSNELFLDFLGNALIFKRLEGKKELKFANFATLGEGHKLRNMTAVWRFGEVSMLDKDPKSTLNGVFSKSIGNSDRVVFYEDGTCITNVSYVTTTFKWFFDEAGTRLYLVGNNDCLFESYEIVQIQPTQWVMKTGDRRITWIFNSKLPVAAKYMNLSSAEGKAFCEKVCNINWVSALPQEGMSEEEWPTLSFVFSDNGTFTFAYSLTEQVVNGTWKISSDSKSFSITMAGKEDILSIKSLSTEEMSLVDKTGQEVKFVASPLEENTEGGE